jgi:hypothetical protein
MRAARGGQKLGDGQRTSTSCWTHAAPARELGYRVHCNHHTVRTQLAARCLRGVAAPRRVRDAGDGLGLGPSVRPSTIRAFRAGSSKFKKVTKIHASLRPISLQLLRSPCRVGGGEREADRKRHVKSTVAPVALRHGARQKPSAKQVPINHRI